MKPEIGDTCEYTASSRLPFTVIGSVNCTARTTISDLATATWAGSVASCAHARPPNTNTHIAIACHARRLPRRGTRRNWVAMRLVPIAINGGRHAGMRYELTSPGPPSPIVIFLHRH